MRAKDLQIREEIKWMTQLEKLRMLEIRISFHQEGKSMKLNLKSSTTQSTLM